MELQQNCGAWGDVLLESRGTGAAHLIAIEEDQLIIRRPRAGADVFDLPHFIEGLARRNNLAIWDSLIRNKLGLVATRGRGNCPASARA